MAERYNGNNHYCKKAWDLYDAWIILVDDPTKTNEEVCAAWMLFHEHKLKCDVCGIGETK